MTARDPWSAVRAELDVWTARRRPALFWWRDDDAVDVNPRLRAMVALSEAHDLTVGLSAIPARVTARLADFVAGSQAVEILVHGLRHENHAGPARAKRELGGDVALDSVLLDAATGLRLARARFGSKCLPVLVPPWNRMTARAVVHLPKLGFRGLSTWKPREAKHPAPGLVQVNAHLDLIDWRHGRTLKSESEIAGLLLRKLRWRRAAKGRAEEPLGVLTHHAYWSAAKQRLMAGLLDVLLSSPAVKFVRPSAAFELERAK
jgi:hypothetical protein